MNEVRYRGVPISELSREELESAFVSMIERFEQSKNGFFQSLEVLREAREKHNADNPLLKMADVAHRYNLP